MIGVQLFPYAKKVNSTSRPAASLGITYQGEMKNGVSMTAPVITFNFAGLTPTQFSYAYIEAFSRYYFVNDWSYSGGLWTGTFSVDVLASYKTDIGDSTQYIKRCYSDIDPDISDSYYPIKSKCNISASFVKPFSDILTLGWYVVGITNSDISGIGGACYYILNQQGFNELKHNMLANPEWTGIDDVSKELVKGLVNPTQYISSVMWFPFEPPHGNLPTRLIDVGWWRFSISVDAYVLSVSSPVFTYIHDFTLPKHPKSDIYSYLKDAPYTHYTLVAQPIGDITIDPSFVYHSDVLRVKYSVDCVSGSATVQLFGKSGSNYYQIAERFGVFGVQMSLSASSSDVLTAGISAASGIYAGFRGNIASGITNAANALSAISPKAETTGIVGNLASFKVDEQIGVVSQFFDIADTSPQHTGNMLCKNRQIKDLSGFILCEDADISISTTSAERDSIKRFMDSGFFYE